MHAVYQIVDKNIVVEKKVENLFHPNSFDFTVAFFWFVIYCYILLYIFSDMTTSSFLVAKTRFCAD